MTNSTTDDLCVEVDITSCIIKLENGQIKVLLDDENRILDFQLTKNQNLNDQLRQQVLKCVDYKLPERWTDFNSIFVWPKERGLEIITKPVAIKEDSQVNEGYRLVDANIALMLLGNTKHGQRLQTILGAW